MKDAKTWNELADEIARIMSERDKLAAALKSVVASGEYCGHCANFKHCGAEIVRCKRFVWRGNTP